MALDIADMFVNKRSGKKEPINIDKIHRVLDWAARDLDNVSVSQVELNSHIQMYNGISTSDIHETIIKAAADLISENTPDYQYLAARLTMFHLRKQAYGRFTPPPLFDHIRKMTADGLYDEHILEDYSRAEIDMIGGFIDHGRDMSFSYAAIKQLQGKYLVQNRNTGRVHESPQMLYALIAMCLFSKYPVKTRLSYVRRFYDLISTFVISLPTPIMAGVRTPTRQFSSCVLIEVDDTLDSISGSTTSIIKYISQRAGIGLNAGRIRAEGSMIRNGDASHTGCLPFYKLFQAAVKSCSQGGVRGGAATLFYPIWHREVETLLVLKNNRGVEDNRVRQLDYGVQLNKFMYQRLIDGGNISLFSPHDVRDMYEAFFQDQPLFEELYLKYEADPTVPRRSIPAIELFSLLMQERASTGRIYIQNVDHCNTHSAFNPAVAPVRQSNLCLEIALPTTPIGVGEHGGEIALCTLSAFNLGLLWKEGGLDLELLEEASDLTIRALDALLDYQEYPVKQADYPARARRSLGVGVINYAYYLAKHGVRYSDGSALDLTHRTFEAIQFHLLQASNRLAKEQGACDWYEHTSYAQGLLPIDTYKSDLDEIVNTPLEMPWETLRSEIAEYGLRNSTVTALMPSETSSQVSNATNGIEPPRGLVSVKQSKDGILKQVVPEYLELKDAYELLWKMGSNKGYIHLVATMQKFVDQSISANTSYDPANYPDNMVPMRVLLADLLMCYKYGVKTLYYHNTRDGSNEEQIELEDDNCAGGACKI